MTAENNLPVVVVVGSGYPLYREYLLADIAAAARVWLLTPVEPVWEKRYITGWTEVDTLDGAAVRRAGRRLAAERTVNGVICWDELRTINAAQLAEDLGLPGGGADAVATCRDKHRTRQALTAARVAQPLSRAVGSADQALSVAAEIGYPVVVKPRGLGASIGVSRVDTPAHLADAYRHAQLAFEDGVPPNASVLVEQCVVGTEISIDCAIVDGTVTPMFVGRKMLGFGAYCEEVGHTVDACDPLLHDPVVGALLTDAHRAVGYRFGTTHTEIMLTDTGPKIIEINSRLGGDLIPYLGHLASGVRAGVVAVNVAVGRAPDLTPTRRRLARVDFLYPADNVVVDDVLVTTDDLPEGIDRVIALAKPGQELDLPPAGHVSSRYGCIITHGKDAAQCQERAARATKLIALHARARVAATA